MLNRKKGIKFAAYVILAIGFIVLAAQTDVREIIYYLSLIDRKYLLLGMLMQIFTMILLAIQWSSMVKMAGFQPNFAQAFLMNAVGNVADALNPGVKVGGEYFRYDQLRDRFGMLSEDSILVVALQKLVSVSAFFLLASMSLVYLIFHTDTESPLIASVSVTIIVFGSIIALLALLFLKPNLLYNLVNKMKIKEMTKDKICRFLNNYHEALDCFKKDNFKIVIQFALALFIWVFYAVKLHIVSKAFGIEMNPFMTAAITYITYMIGMIPLLPGSIGSFEASMIALFALAGIASSFAVSVSVVFRIVTFWFEFAFCAFVLVVERLFKTQKKCVE